MYSFGISAVNLGGLGYEENIDGDDGGFLYMLFSFWFFLLSMFGLGRMVIGFSCSYNT